MAARHVIVGGGTAGHNAINTIRQEEGERSEIVLVSAERPYSRMVLPYYLGRTIAESHVFTATPAKLGRLGVTTHLGRRATGLDAKAGQAHARRRCRARVRRPPGRDRVVRRPGPGPGRGRPRGAQLLDARSGPRRARRDRAGQPRRDGGRRLHRLHHPQLDPRARGAADDRRDRAPDPAADDRPPGSVARRRLAPEARRRDPYRRDADRGGAARRPAPPPLQGRRGPRRRRRDHGDGHPHQPRVAGGLGRPREPGRRRRRPPPLERAERVRRRRRGRGAGPRDRSSPTSTPSSPRRWSTAGWSAPTWPAATSPTAAASS